MPISNLLGAALFVLGSLAATSCLGQQSFGSFSGNPQTEWDPDGRHMYLLRDFTYTDQDAKVWTAAKGLKIDGASIPQAFWWVIGGPFEGKYRNASVVHDAECTAPYKNDWRAVHKMFYNGSRAGGASELQAKTMYMAVYFCGPRWPWNGVAPPYECFDRDTFIRGRILIRKNPGLSLESIEAFTPSQLRADVTDVELESERLRIEYNRINGSLRLPGELD